ncbi:hypothetical protein C8R43DRAFT_957312 [Mycena crocata]|nr:hypothetical protein C8R43DRAFT_957312 [Mycena crocata]
MSSRAGCSVCLPGYCYTYDPLNGQDGDCCCGHPKVAHPIPAPPTRLPNRGQCMIPGCQDCKPPECDPVLILQVFSCIFLANQEHLSPAITSGRAPLGVSWHRDKPPVSAGGDPQRRIDAHHHQAFGPEVGSSFPRQPQHAFPPGGSSSRGGVSKALRKPGKFGQRNAVIPIPQTGQKQAVTPPDIVLYFALLPLTVCPLPDDVPTDFYDAYPYLFTETGDFRLEGSGSALFTRLTEFNLFFELELPHNQPLTEPIYDKLSKKLVDVMRDRDLHFPSQTLPFTPNPHLPDRAEWHSHCFEQKLWHVHSNGIKPRATRLRRFPVSEVLWYEFTLETLTQGKMKGWASPFKKNQNVHFISSVCGPIQGIVPAISMTDPHICFPIRVFGGLPGPFVEDDPGHTGCFDVCSRSRLLVLGPSPSNTPAAKDKGKNRQAPGPPIAGPSNAAGSSASDPLFLPGSPLSVSDSHPPTNSPSPINLTVYDDPNETDFQAAIRLSLHDQGVTQDPRPRTPPSQMRPRSTEPGTPPARQRRRTAEPTPSPIVAAPAASPAPVSVNKRFATTFAWLQAVSRILPSHTLTISGRSVEAMAQTLLGHILELYGGEPWLPADPRDAASIISTPPTPAGQVLLKNDASWVVGGESSGEGVGRTVMDALMTLVFSDQSVWKDVGEEKVIQTEAYGVPISDEQLCKIHAYGYACMLYMLHLRALPEQLSVFFAASILLLPQSDLILDVDYLRLAAPAQMDMLASWPTSVAGFASTNSKLAYLTGTYFDRQPSSVLNLGPVAFESYGHNLRRRVMYGTEADFDSCAEFQAFAKTFNYVLQTEPEVTVAQSFGTSLKPILIKMSANRLQKVDDLLCRIRWLPSKEPDLVELEKKYIAAFNRYISGRGIVRHRLLPMEKLTLAEREANPTNPLLPPGKTMIEMAFYCSLRDGENALKIDVVGNPQHWPDHLPLVKVHTCFESVEVPVEPLATLLNQDIPEDDTATDFDLYLYTMYRPFSRFSEYGGLYGFNLLTSVSQL